MREGPITIPVQAAVAVHHVTITATIVVAGEMAIRDPWEIRSGEYLDPTIPIAVRIHRIITPLLPAAMIHLLLPVAALQAAAEVVAVEAVVAAAGSAGQIVNLPKGSISANNKFA